MASTRILWVSQRQVTFLLELLEEVEADKGTDIRGLLGQLRQILTDFKDGLLKLREETARANANAFWDALKYELDQERKKDIPCPSVAKAKTIVNKIKKMSKSKAKKARKKKGK